MDTRTFVQEARRILAPIMDDSGAVLYSAEDTLSKGRFYILCLNPGGTPGGTEDYTIRQSLNDLSGCTTNAYLDECWYSDARPNDPRRMPLQHRLNTLMTELGESLHDVCASNLIFTRSPDASGSNYPHNADLCWPVHQMILRIVQPSVVIAFGNNLKGSPYTYLKKVSEQHKEYDPCPAGHRNWECRAFGGRIEGLELLVVGLPHLSRYTFEEKHGVLQWIKSTISGHAT